jgi:hypothetical protein
MRKFIESVAPSPFIGARAGGEIEPERSKPAVVGGGFASADRRALLSISRLSWLLKSGAGDVGTLDGTDRGGECLAVVDHLRIEGKEALLNHPLDLLAGERDALVAEQAVGH